MPKFRVASGPGAALIGDLYEAVMTPDALSTIPKILADVGGGRTGAVCIFRQAGVEAIVHGIPDEAVALYQSRFRELDPWTRHLMVHRPDGNAPAAMGRRLVPEEQFVRTEYCQDFARPFDLAEAIGGAVPISPGRIAVFSIHRPRRAQPFQLEEEEKIQSFTCHLQRALQVRERFGGDTRDLGLAALDQLAFGAVVCDVSGRVLLANKQAEESSRAGYGIVLGRASAGIGAVRPADGHKLRATLEDACLGGAGGSIMVHGHYGSASMVLVSPLPRPFSSRSRLALLILRTTTARSAITPDVLSKLFGLTRAEAELAAEIAGGKSLAEIGADRGRTENTLRTQLTHVFRKTGTRNQAGLTRLVSLLPPLR